MYSAKSTLLFQTQEYRAYAISGLQAATSEGGDGISQGEDDYQGDTPTVGGKELKIRCRANIGHSQTPKRTAIGLAAERGDINEVDVPVLNTNRYKDFEYIGVRINQHKIRIIATNLTIL